MAHLAKFTKAACGHMFKHYERAKTLNPETGQAEYIKFANQDIDPQRTHLNYNLAVHQAMRQGDFIRKRCSEVKLQNRKDVNVMCSWVLTAPKNLPETEQERFFKASYEFMANRYGKENVISAYVHLDETTPHIHFSFIPITEDKKKGGFKVSAKEVINKRELQAFHQDLDSYLEKALGHSVDVLNGSTKDGNKSVAELKEKSTLERIEKLQEEADVLDGKVLEKEERLNELNGKILTKEELNAIEGKKSIGGALKNVMFEEWLSVKATAEHVDEVTAENKQLKADLEKEKQNFAKTTAEIRKSHQQEIASLKEENRKLNNRVSLQSQAARRLNLEEPLNKAAREIFEELRQKQEIKNTSRSRGRR